MILVQQPTHAEQDSYQGVLVRNFGLLQDLVIDSDQGELEHWLYLSRVLIFEGKKVIEEDKSRVIGHLVITATEALVAEVYQRCGPLRIFHSFLATCRCEDIGEDFQAHLMTILDQPGISVFQIVRGKITYDAD